MALSAAVVVLLAVCIALWRRCRRTAGKVAFLFNALDNGDYTFRFAEDGTSVGEGNVNATLNRVKDILSHARDEQKEREKYFELILDSVDTAIIVLDCERGIVLRYNKAAQRMARRNVITHIDQVEDMMKSLSVRETRTELRGRQVRILA